jgi:DNA-binding NtrC family response regulator
MDQHPDAWRVWAQQLPTDGAGVRLADLPVSAAATDCADRDAVLTSIGYAPLPATTRLAGEAHRRWLHRHVALIVEEPLCEIGRRWIRELAHASPRAHLILRSPGSVTVARERAVAWPEWNEVIAQSRRGSASKEWISAAVESAARRGDEWASASALMDYGRAVMKNGCAHDVQRLRARCRAWLARSSQPGPRSKVSSTAACAALWSGDLEAATAALAVVVVECRLDEVPAPPWIVAAEFDVALWMGQWDAAEQHLRDLPPDSSEAVGRASLLAWLRHDRSQLEHSAPPKTRVNDASASGMGWQRVASLLLAAGRRDTTQVSQLVPRVVSDGPLFWSRAAAVEALRAVGAEPEAERLLAKCRRSARSPLESLLLAHLARQPPVPRLFLPASAAGIRRWGERRNVMTMWGGVSALLDEVNNAEDDAAALRRGCRWVRTHTGTARVIVLAADTGTALVCEPDGAHAGEDDVRVPVRQGGVTIAWVMAARKARDAEELTGCVRTLASVCAPAVRARMDVLRAAQSGDVLSQDLLGHSPSMVALRAAVARAAPTTFPVLIEGESGVGKELVARALHRLSARRDRRLAAINCAALTDELFEAELFGHTRGAFTGAVGPRTGLFEDAHQGTLFLDEVGELSPRGQAKLLRVLQEGEIRRIGDNQSRLVDVRVVAATNRALTHEAAAGRFREDLVFRLAVVRLKVPPLRERVQDIPGLAQTFWAQAVRHRESRAWLAPDAMAALCRYNWPGNVRELQNVVAGLVLAAPDRGRVTARHVAIVLHAQGVGEEMAGMSLDEARRLCDRRLVATALARHAGCRSAAARDLGVTRQGLAKLMTRLAVPAEGV